MKVIVSIRVEPEIKEKLEERAGKERRTVSQMAELLLEQSLKEDRDGNNH